MCAEAFGEETGDQATDRCNAGVGAKLVEMALSVDLVFAGELARQCGGAVWEEVGAVVVERFRAAYRSPDANFRQYAVAAMLATGMADFHDIMSALLSSGDQQTRLSTYRLWPDIRLSSFGPDWPEQVRKWSEAERVDLVAELLHHRTYDEIVSFVVADDSGGSEEGGGVRALVGRSPRTRSSASWSPWICRHSKG